MTVECSPSLFIVLSFVVFFWFAWKRETQFKMKSKVVKTKNVMSVFGFGYSIDNGHEMRTGTHFGMSSPRERNGEVRNLTLILLTWRIWWAPNNVSKWQMGFNPAFKGLIPDSRLSKRPKKIQNLVSPKGRLNDVIISCCNGSNLEFRPEGRLYWHNFYKHAQLLQVNTGTVTLLRPFLPHPR